MSNVDRGTEPDDDNFGLPDPQFVPLEDLDKKPSSAYPESPSNNFTQDQADHTPADDEVVFADDPERETTEPVSYTYGAGGGTGQSSYSRNAFDDDSGKKLKVILAVLLPVVLLTAGYLVYQFWYAGPSRQEAEIEKALELESKARREKEAAITRKEVPVIEVPVIPETGGTIETITSPTGKFYIVAHSSIDGDLIMDRAKVLSAEGISTAIIPPFGRWKFYRLAITNDQTFPLAQEKAEQLKEKYGKDLWVMRY